MGHSSIPTIHRRIVAFNELLTRGTENDGTPTKLESAIDRICAAALTGNVKEAERILDSPAFTDRDQLTKVSQMIDELFFAPQEKEWDLRGAPQTALIIGHASIPTIHKRIATLNDFFTHGTENDGTPTKLESAIDRICAAALTGNIKEANTMLHGPAFTDHEQRTKVRQMVNEIFFFPQEKEWNLHGAPRTFRFWTEAEKRTYLQQTCDVAKALDAVSAHTVLGFGGALAFLRDGDFIPHDDDMDLVVAFENKDCTTLGAARKKVKSALEAAGLRCSGDYISHWNVFFKDGSHIDVFVGLIEDGRVSWFPSARKGLAMEDVFPARHSVFFGIECPLPRNLERYVEVTYGADWRSPIPNWNHAWDKKQFEDVL